jgi:nucleotide-binding universal stress UspA family protein
MQPATVTLGSPLAQTKSLFERVFVLVDFTSASHRAVAVAFDLKRAFGSRICLFGLAESTGGDDFLGGLGAPSTPSDLVSAELGRLRRFIDNVAPGFAESADVEVKARAVVKPADDVHDEAHRWDATLVVAAANAEGFFRSPAEKLVRGFDIPVLLIPAVEMQSEPRITGAPPVDADRDLAPGISRRRGGF